MNEEQNVHNEQVEQPLPSQESTSTDLSTTPQKAGWSWGGFMFGPMYLIATKNYRYLLFYLLYLIPVIQIIAAAGIAIYLGIKGRELVANSSMFTNQDERNGFNRAMDHAGFISFIISAIAFAVVFLFMGTMISAMLGAAGVPTDF